MKREPGEAQQSLIDPFPEGSKLLVGIPAFRLPGHVRNSINAVCASPASVLIIDNNAENDVKGVINTYTGRASIITNAENNFCNGAWNQILNFGLNGDYEIIGLGTDSVVNVGWYDLLMNRLRDFPNEIISPTESLPTGLQDHTAVHHEWASGQLFFLPRKAAEQVYPIPSTIRHWFGDNYIFDRLKRLGWRLVSLRDMTMYSQGTGAVTAVSGNDLGNVIEEDKVAWGNLVREGKV